MKVKYWLLRVESESGLALVRARSPSEEARAVRLERAARLEIVAQEMQGTTAKVELLDERGRPLPQRAPNVLYAGRATILAPPGQWRLRIVGGEVDLERPVDLRPGETTRVSVE